MSNWVRIETTIDYFMQDDDTVSTVLLDVVEGMISADSKEIRVISIDAREIADV